MAVKAAYENYTGPNRDAIENFHGNQLFISVGMST